MNSEQRRALANTVPTTEVIRDAVTFPRDRLGDPLDISGPRFDAWLARVKRDAARTALGKLADESSDMTAQLYASGQTGRADIIRKFTNVIELHRDANYPEGVAE